MKGPMIKRTLVLVLAMFLILTAAPIFGADAGDGKTGGGSPGRASADHNGSLSIFNFSGCQPSNLSLGTGGGPAQLQRGEGYYAKTESPVVSDTASIVSYDLAENSKDEFIVVWNLQNSPLSNWLQRFDKEGIPIGGQMRIGPANYQAAYPDIAVNSKDEMIVVWADNSSGVFDTDYRVYFQRYDRNGTALGNSVRVFAYEAFQQQCTVCVGRDDNFLVVWEDFSTGSSILTAQWFDPAGNKVNGQISVSPSSYHNILPKIAMAPDGSFAIVWIQYTLGPIVDYFNVYAQWFDSQSNKVGARVPIYTDNVTSLIYSQIGADSQGKFLLAWDAMNQSQGVIDMQWFDSGGNRIPNGGTRIANASRPSLAIRPDDEVLVAYDDLNTTSGPLVIKAFDRNWTQKGDTVTLVSGAQAKDRPLLAMVPADNFMAIWYDGRNGKNNIMARYFFHPCAQSGSLVTEAFAPSNLFSWTMLDATASAYNSSVCSLTYSFSTDNGSFWQSVAPNGSLAAANGAPSIRIRADFATSDNSTSPVIDSLNLSYNTDRLPVIGDHPGLSGWKNEPQTILSLASDPDGDPLTYNWSQTGGPPASLKDTASAWLNFTPNRSGEYVYKLSVGDGLGESAPVLIHYNISNRLPVAVFSASTTNVFADVPVSFNASASSGIDDNITGFNFRFGDGNESGWGPNATATHAYSSVGIYNASVSVRDEEGNETASASVQMTVTLNTVPRLIVSKPKEGQTFNTTAISVDFTVNNFVISQTGGHIHYQLDTAGEVMWFSSSPFTLANLTDGKHLLRVYLADASHNRLLNPEASAQVNFTVQLPPMPDLAVTSTDIKLKPDEPKEGDMVTITATIYNVGQLDAGTFTVRFLVDGTALPDQTVLTLGKGANIAREAKWKAKAGSHTVQVVIDPSGNISEPAKGNNEASINLSVPKKAAPGAEFPWLMIAVVLVVGVVAAAAAVMLMRRKKPVTVVQYQPPPTQPAFAPPPQPQAPPAMPPWQPPMPPSLPPQAPPPIPPPS
jgi:hypothetical protein